VVVGPGEYDRIRIHRVVKETKPYRPLEKMEGVLLLPGAPQRFEPIFMQPAASGVPTEEGSVALFLASNGVDVWGMDYGWSFIPYPTTDFSALEGWAQTKDAAHAQTALSIARWLRARSGQGAGPMHVLGFSYGGFLVYAIASDDTVRPGNLKNVKGIISIDGNPFKDNSESRRASVCATLPAIEANLATIFHVDGSASMKRGQAARDYPDALSPSGLAALPPYFLAVPANTFTNYQFAVANGIRNLTYGGTYTPSPVSVTPYYTDGSRVVALQVDTPPYFPYRFNYEGNAARCDSEDYPVSFDDHVGEVSVPIFGIARQQSPTLDVLTRTASWDVTTLLLNPGLLPSLYGHGDQFLANDAASVVWRPILEWIRAHR
jgi:dienelactone hydrolase